MVKRALQLHCVWTVIAATMVIGINTSSFMNDEEANELCLPKETCECGRKILIWYLAHLAFLVFLLLVRLQAFVSISRKYPARKVHKKLYRQT